MGTLAACLGLPLLFGTLAFGLFILYKQLSHFFWLPFGMAIMFVSASLALLWFSIPIVVGACLPVRWEIRHRGAEWRFQMKLGRLVIRQVSSREPDFQVRPTYSRGDHGYALYGQSGQRRWRLLGCVFTATLQSASRQADADLAALRQYVSTQA